MSQLDLENRILIHEFIAEYSHIVDNYRGEEWAALFLENAKIVGDYYVIEGHEGLLKQVAWLKRKDMEYRHNITNVYIEDGATNDHAVVNAYGLVSNWAGDSVSWDMFVEYRFELVKRDDKWKIAGATAKEPYRKA